MPYAGVHVANAVSSKRTRKPQLQHPAQLLLPFEITSPPSSQRLVLKLVQKSTRRYHLQLTVKMTA